MLTFKNPAPHLQSYFEIKDVYTKPGNYLSENVYNEKSIPYKICNCLQLLISLQCCVTSAIDAYG